MSGRSHNHKLQVLPRSSSLHCDPVRTLQCSTERNGLLEAPEPIGTLVRPEIPDLPGSKVGSDESESLSTGGRGQTAFPSWFLVLWGKKKTKKNLDPTPIGKIRRSPGRGAPPTGLTGGGEGDSRWESKAISRAVEDPLTGR